MDFSKHSAGTTSVKVRQAPGGKSNFSLAWDVSETKPQPAQKVNVPAPLQERNQGCLPVQKSEGKTSVKVHNPPGGRSNIVFG